MGRVYGEPIVVRTGEDGRPVGFRWRRRRYAVISVQEHWMVNRDWWREPAPAPGCPGLEFWRVEAVPAYGYGDHQGGDSGDQAYGDQTGGDQSSGDQGSADGGDQAGGDQIGGDQGSGYGGDRVGGYELRRDIAAGTWTLRRIAD